MNTMSLILELEFRYVCFDMLYDPRLFDLYLKEYEDNIAPIGESLLHQSGRCGHHAMVLVLRLEGQS